MATNPILKWIFSRFPTKSESWSRCHYQTLSDQYWLKKPWLCHFLKQYRTSETSEMKPCLPFSAVKETRRLTNANYKFHLKNPMKKACLGLWSWDGSRDVMDGVNCHKSPIHPILTLVVLKLVRIIAALHASSISLVHAPLLNVFAVIFDMWHKSLSSHNLKSTILTLHSSQLLNGDVNTIFFF